MLMQYGGHRYNPKNETHQVVWRWVAEARIQDHYKEGDSDEDSKEDSEKES